MTIHATHHTSTGLFHSEPAGGGIPARDGVDPADTWDLSALYPDDAAWEKDFTNLAGRFSGYGAFRSTLGASASAVSAAMEFDSGLDRQIERLHHFASLRKSEDSGNDANLSRMARLQNLLTRIAESSSFLTPELQAIPDEVFARFLADDALETRRVHLRKIRRLKPHTLGDREERLLALGGSTLGASRRIFGQLLDVDMKFGSLADENGREIELSHGALSSFLVKRDPALRRAAFHQYYAEMKDHRHTLAASLAESVKADVFQARARNYPSAREAALFPDEMPVAVYDNLISTVRGHLGVLHRYYDLRRRLLGLDEIHHYDTYVPLVSDVVSDTPWDRAVEMVCAALAPLGGEYVETLRSGLLGRWCDRYETKGKRSGAFSSGSYGNPPFILMNYKRDVFSDVYTLAHEGGHSMHTWFAQRHQTYQDHHYPIFTAEVASTFNEELLTHHLLETTDDPRMRAYLINRQIDDLRGTLFRQTMFAEFEKIIHETEEAGGSLTLDSFRGGYRALLDAYLGSDFAIDADLEFECLRIPHFYNAFYVYKYATGISAACALARRVLDGGAAEVAEYLGFLKSGGSKPPLDTLRAAGVDMTGPEPIQDALALFERRVNELESLLT